VVLRSEQEKWRAGPTSCQYSSFSPESLFLSSKALIDLVRLILSQLGAKGHGLAGDLIIAYIEKELCEMDRLESRYGSGSSQTAWDTIGSLDSSPPPVRLHLLPFSDIHIA
jgi:hypothetical protein